MSTARAPVCEIQTLTGFDAHLAAHRSLRGCVVKSLDLHDRRDTLSRTPVTGTIFLGCPMTRADEDDLVARGGLVFPALPHLPFNPYRARLYQAEDLYWPPTKGDVRHSSARYNDCLDGQVYGWYCAQGPLPDLPASLAMALHDQAIGDALADMLATLDTGRLVGVMGGHATRRGDPTYRLAAHLGAALTQAGFTVVTGGGPGAMEAANLGARLGVPTSGAADPGVSSLDVTIDRLAMVPDFAPDITAWAQVALDVAASLPDRVSLSIPTWFYGHEPPNAFATQIAKYFSNALREDVLLTRCGGGLVVLPGAAGTVQEIFQCANRDYYASTPALVTPIVLVGRHYWTHQLPAWPLLRALGDARAMASRLTLVDTPAEAVVALRTALASRIICDDLGLESLHAG